MNNIVKFRNVIPYENRKVFEDNVENVRGIYIIDVDAEYFDGFLRFYRKHGEEGVKKLHKYIQEELGDSARTKPLECTKKFNVDSELISLQSSVLRIGANEDNYRVLDFLNNKLGILSKKYDDIKLKVYSLKEFLDTLEKE